MGYFTMRLRDTSGTLIFETDFSLHELSMLANRILASLRNRPYLASDLQDFQVTILPRYAGEPNLDEFVKPDPHAPVATQSDLITVTELDIQPDPGSTHQPPAFSSHGSARREDWIRIDPQAEETNEPVHFLTLRINSRSGELLYQRDFSLNSLQALISYVVQILIDKRQLDATSKRHLRAEFVARVQGQPTINPLLKTDQTMIVLHIRPEDTSARQTLNRAARRLIDWDAIEAEEAADVQINVIETSELTLRHRSPPAAVRKGAPIENAAFMPYIRREVVDQLCAYTSGRTGETSGVLVGCPFLLPDQASGYVEISAIIPVSVQPGSFATADADIIKLVKEHPGSRIVGIYCTQLFSPLISAVTPGPAMPNERLALSSQDYYLFLNNFRELWHVALVVDPIGQQICFYQRRDNRIVACLGYNEIALGPR